MCLSVAALVQTKLASEKKYTHYFVEKVEQARAQLSLGAVPASDALSTATNSTSDPAQWLLRLEANDVVHQVGEAAQFHSVSLRTLSVSHQAASTQTWGRVSLDVSASGSYAALKTWQAAMQQRFPTLSVKSLRTQGNPLSPGGLEAQVLWMLHVRD